jgi:2-octaprenylphenol hydroxylase
MVAAMEGFKRLFAGDQVIKKLIRDTGLSLANRSQFTKQKIIQHAMGLEGELPKLAKMRLD